MISSVSAANRMRIPYSNKEKQEVSFVLPPVKGTHVPLTRRPLTDLGLMIKTVKRMTARSASPSSTIKEETSFCQSLCKPGCNLPESIHFQPTMASDGTRGVASRFTVEGYYYVEG
jgi:hypothetical protein